MLLQTDSPLTARGGPFSPHAAAVGSAPTQVSAFSSRCNTKRSTHAASPWCNHLRIGATDTDKLLQDAAVAIEYA